MSYLKRGPSEHSTIEYVSSLASLLYLRGLNHADHFILAANLGGVGAFGDNVFLYRENNRLTACLFHMMQTARAGPNPKLYDRILYFFLSFRKVVSALPWLEEQVGEEIQELEIICYTDAKYSSEASYSHADHIADGGGLVCGSGSLPRAWEVFEEVNKFWDFLVDISDDFGLGVDLSTIKDSVEMFESVVASEEILRRVVELKNDLSVDSVEMLLSEIGSPVDKLDFKAFLEKIKVFHSQPDEVKLTELVKDEFLKLSGASDSGVFSEEFAKCLEETFESFLKEVFEWVENGDNWLSRYSQIWANVVTSVARVVGEPMLKTLQRIEVQFQEDTLERLSEQILENCVICVDCKSDNTTLNLAKVHNVLEGLLYFLLNIDTLIKYRALIVKAIERFWCSVLVIDTTGAEVNELGIILNDIHRALSANHDARLILVTRDSREVLKQCLEMIGVIHEDFDDVISWTSFSARCQTKLLCKPVYFQGVETTLGVLLGPYSEIFSEFKGDFLHSILTTEDMVVGCDLPEVPDYFPRTISRSVSFNMTILRSNLANTLFAIAGTTLSDVIKIIPEGENYHIYDPTVDSLHTFEGIQIAVIEDDAHEEQFSKTTANGNINVHYFNLTGEKLTWKWSVDSRDLSTLEQYLLKEKTDRFHIENASQSPEKLTIITGNADTGKTTFLRHVARGTKESDPSLWVVCLNLPEHEEFINNTLFDKPESLFPIMRELATYPYDSVLSDMLFERYWRDGNVAVFIDGFEGIPWVLNEQIVDMIKLIRSNAKHVFVGCRSRIKSELCGKLSTFAFSLLPIDVEDQRRFLLKKWSNKVPDNERLSLFVEAVLTLLQNSVGEEDKRLCCPPLLTAIVAHAYEGELLTFTTSGNIVVPKKLNIIHFYEKYVEKCCFDYLTKRSANTVLTQQLLIANKLDLLNRYMVLAVMLLLPKDDTRQLHTLIAHYEAHDWRRLRQSVGEGSLIALVNDHPVFVHRTLPEYFLAMWLSEVRLAARAFIEERFLDKRFSGVRLWFDRILSRNRDLHWAVLNDDEQAAGQLLAAGADVNAPDEGGRTALHLAAAHDLPHMVGLLLVAGADVELVDVVLGWRALRYADRLRAWDAAERLLPAVGKLAKSDLVATSALVDSEVLLNAAIVGTCERGNVRLLEFFHSLGVDVKKVIDFEGSTALHIAAENGRSEMVRHLLIREMEMADHGPVWKRLCGFKRSSHSGKPDVNIQRNDGSSPVILAAQEGHADTLRVLFEFGASPNIKKLSGATALHVAVSENNIEAARALLEAGAEVDREDGEAATPLHASAAEGNSGLVRLLLECGAAPSPTDNAGATPLHWAAAGGHMRCVEALVRAGAFINAKDGDLCTPLHWAAMEGQSPVVKFLLSKGADVTIINRAGGTAVHAAARENRPGTLQTFKNAGVDMSITNPDGTTPLHWACNKGHDAAAKYLLELGLVLEIANYDGYTALHLAALRGHTSLVQRLLKAGAKPEGGRHSRRAPPLHLAAKGEHTSSVRALLDAGANVNVRDPVGATALHWASWCGNEDTVKMLLAAGADTALADNHGSVPLHWAAGEGHGDAATALLLAGAAPDAVNRDGDTPLHWAAKEGRADAVAALLLAGAKPDVRNGEGATPAHLASRVPHTDIVQILEDAIRAADAEQFPTSNFTAVAMVEREQEVRVSEGEKTIEEKDAVDNSESDEPEEDDSSTSSSSSSSLSSESNSSAVSSELPPSRDVDTRLNEKATQQKVKSDEDDKDEEIYEDVSPHTSSIFKNSLFDWEDDDKSKVSLVRLSMGVSDYNPDLQFESERAQGAPEIPPRVHRPVNTTHAKGGGAPVQRRISKLGAGDKTAANKANMVTEDKIIVSNGPATDDNLNDVRVQIGQRNHVQNTNNQQEMRISIPSQSCSEESSDSEDEAPPLPTSPQPTSPTEGGGIFSAIYDAGSSLMRYARRTIGSETDLEQDETTPMDSHDSVANGSTPSVANKNHTVLTTNDEMYNPQTVLPVHDERNYSHDSMAFASGNTAIDDSWRETDSSDSEEEEVMMGFKTVMPSKQQAPSTMSVPNQLGSDPATTENSRVQSLQSKQAITRKEHTNFNGGEDSDISC